MRFLVIILFFFLEIVAITFYSKRAEIIRGTLKDTKPQNVRKEKICIGIFILAALLCGYQTAWMVQSVFDVIKVFLVYVIFSLSVLTDLELYRIPNIFPITLIVGRIVLFIPEYFCRKEVFLDLLKESLLGGTISLIILLIVSLISKGGFGMGDVKLLAAEGCMMGLYGVINTLLYALVCCAAGALLLLVSHKKTLKDKIPFAPFIYAGFVICVAMGGY